MATVHAEPLTRSEAMSAGASERFGAASGVAFTVLAVAAAVIAPTPPEADASGSTITRYLTSNTDRLAGSTALFALAALAIIGFFAFVHRRLRLRCQDGGLLAGAFLIAGAAVVFSALLAAVLEAALVQHIAPAADEPTLGAAYVVWMLVFHTATSIAMSAALVCAAIAIVRWSAFPRWLAAFAALAATLSLIDDASDLTSSGTSLGPLGPLAFALVMVWILGASIAALMRPG
jgi:hypothetical protein